MPRDKKSQQSATQKYIIITGAAGLIGSEAVRFFCNKNFKVIGIDNDFRKYFFGPSASTNWNRELLESAHSNYLHLSLDIRDGKEINRVFEFFNPDLIIHAAAQPSHDWAAKEPLTDFTINALGTHNLLEACRNHSPNATFIFTSTNKVYGDNPNILPLIEGSSRYEIDPKHQYKNGIDESMSLDQTTHSIFGVSKTAADLMVQEYGRYFGIKTGTFRGGCLTGPAHSPAQLHGFLAYLVYSIVNEVPYTIFGYKGKQVRDNIHSSDVVNAFWEFYLKPKPGEVYNIGGTRHSNVSVNEAIKKIENITGKKAKIEYNPENRIGDHIWYISNMSRFKKDYPKWQHSYTGDQILEELCDYALKAKNAQ